MSARWRIVLASAALIVAASCVLLMGRVLQTRYPAPGNLVATNGRLRHLYCFGAGEPAVILETGIGVDWSSWSPVAAKVAGFARICVYDRAGYGWSESGPRPRTAARLAGELHSLLGAAKAPPPYLLVGASFGGSVARVYASRYRDSLAGVVLVDPQSEGEPLSRTPLLRRAARLLPPVDLQRLPRLLEGNRALPPNLWDAPRAFQRRYLIGASARQLQAERDEIAALQATEEEVRAAVFPQDLPLTVITAKHLISPRQYYPPPVPEPGPIHREFHAKLAARSARGKLVAADDSGHAVQLDQPELIVEAVRDQVSEYKSGQTARAKY